MAFHHRGALWQNFLVRKNGERTVYLNGIVLETIPKGAKIFVFKKLNKRYPVPRCKLTGKGIKIYTKVECKTKHDPEVEFCNQCEHREKELKHETKMPDYEIKVGD